MINKLLMFDDDKLYNVGVDSLIHLGWRGQSCSDVHFNVNCFCQMNGFQVVPGPATLLTPEPGLLVLGMKSYGRGSAFLLRLFDNFLFKFYVVAIAKQ